MYIIGAVAGVRQTYYVPIAILSPFQCPFSPLPSARHVDTHAMTPLPAWLRTPSPPKPHPQEPHLVGPVSLELCISLAAAACRAAGASDKSPMTRSSAPHCLALSSCVCGEWQGSKGRG